MEKNNKKILFLLDFGVVITIVEPDEVDIQLQDAKRPVDQLRDVEYIALLVAEKMVQVRLNASRDAIADDLCKICIYSYIYIRKNTFIS